MLTILNSSGLQMELSPGTVLSIEKTNPLFNDPDKFFQDVVYNAKAPISPGNKAFFSHGHRVEALKNTYEFPVQVNVYGKHFFTGICRYKMVTDAFDFYLQVNFATIANKVKNTYLPDIRTFDQYQLYNLNDGQMEGLMWTIAANPRDYNFAFFPVRNTHMFDKPAGQNDVWAESGWMNQFSFDLQTFAVGRSPWAPANKYFLNPEVPFFKLTYVFGNVLKYLGFTPAGGFFSDPEINKLYIYTRMAIAGAPYQFTAPRGNMVPSFRYMPYMTVGDFLRQLRERLHLALDFDLVSGTCTVESFETLKNSDITDISEYVEKVEENAPPEEKGYSVVLKNDGQDPYYSDAPFRMLVGAPTDTTTDLDCTTLVESGEDWAPITEQFLINDSWYQHPNKVDVPPFDNPFSWNTAEGPASRNAWPLRLLKFNGMVDKGDGKYWPEAKSFALDATDAAYYQFLSEAKTIKVAAAFPPAMLQTLRVTGRVSLISNEGFQLVCIIKKLNYDLGGTRELIRVKLDLLSLSYPQSSSYKIDRPVQDRQLTEANFMAFKASWDPDIAGFKELHLEMSTSTPGHSLTVPDVITNPADSWGAGGDIVWAVKSAPDMKENSLDVQLIIRQGKPKYIERLGEKYNFTYYGDYSACSLPLVYWNYRDYLPWWIVF